MQQCKIFAAISRTNQQHINAGRGRVIVSPAPLVYPPPDVLPIPSHCHNTTSARQYQPSNRSTSRLSSPHPLHVPFARPASRFSSAGDRLVICLSVVLFPPLGVPARAPPRLPPLQEKSDGPRCGGPLDYRALGTQRGGNRNLIFVAVINSRIWFFSFSLVSRVNLLSAHPACFYRSHNWSPISNPVKS